MLQTLEISFIGNVPAGFPSPAMDYLETVLDVRDLLIKNPNATHIAKVNGSSMIDADIEDGDIVIIDRSVEPKNNKIVLAIVSKDFTLKRFVKKNGEVFLMPANKDYPAIKITEEMEMVIFGVVRWVLKEK